MKGLDGSPKMAKRKMNYFTLHDTPKTIKERISNAFTGGRASGKEQHELGGVPEACPIYEICLFHFVEDDQAIAETYHACKTGKLLCGEHKTQTTDTVLRFVKEHRQKRKRFTAKAREVLRIDDEGK
jgi:tryptophanyl-tRNA synthetase